MNQTTFLGMTLLNYKRSLLSKGVLIDKCHPEESGVVHETRIKALIQGRELCSKILSIYILNYEDTYR